MKVDYQERELRGVKRTICIGLGGTGRNVLMQLRRLIVDRYGKLDQLPIVSFVHLDTDKAAFQISGLRTGNTYHGEDISLRDSEKVSATMSAKEVTNFVQGLERRSQSDRPSPYDHIGRWFPPQLMRNLKAIEEGAKGIRPVGRLAFFHNYPQFRTAVMAAENRTRGYEATLLQKGLRVEPGLNIFVITSLCGGTGSGMFLDVAYSLRKVYGAQGAQILGYLVISPELYGNTPGQNVNTYAALKELNYYTTPGTKFEAVYEQQNLTLVQEPRPPFDYTYLVSSQTAGDYAILEQRKLCNVIAHKIALDFSGEIAPVVSGMRDNFLTHLIQLDRHRRPNSQRYLTFGLAAVYFPRDRITHITLNRISQQLINFWLNGKGQSPDLKLLLEQFLVNYRWQNRLEQRNGLTLRLAESVQEANRPFSEALKNWRNKLERTINECKNQSDRFSLCQQLPREFRQQFRTVQPGETESIRGIWLTRLKQAQPKLTELLKQNIREFLENLLTPSNGNFSVRNVRGWLEALLTELNVEQRDLGERIKNLGSFYTSEQLEKRWRDTEETIREIEQQFQLFGVRKNAQVQSEAQRSLQRVCELIQHNFNLAASQEILALITELQRYVQDLSTQVTSFSRTLDNLLSDGQREEVELRQLNFDEMSGEAIFNDADITRCYETLLPEQELRERLIFTSSEIVSSLTQGQSLAYFIERDRITEQELQSQVYSTIDRLYTHRSSNIVDSVIKRFLENYSASQRSTRLSQIMQEATPLLRLNKSDPYFTDDLQKSARIIGFKDTDEPEVKQFKDLLRKDLGIPDTQLKPTQTEEEILIVTEYAAFPLRLIDGLEEMRKHYEQICNFFTRNLSSFFPHNDYQISWSDIIPPDIQLMEQIEDIFYPCLALDLLGKNPETQQITVRYHDSNRGYEKTINLSPIWNQALEQLAIAPDVRQTLASQLNAEIEKIKRQPNLWNSYYIPKLQRFVQEIDNLPEADPNHLYKEMITGKPATPELPGEEGAIVRFRRRIERELAANQLPEQASPALTSEIIDAEYENQVSDRKSFEEDLVQQLERLVQLRQGGYLTEEQFNKFKQRLLDS